MKLSEELHNLERLRWNGTLTEQEFAQAKAVVLGQPPANTPTLTCLLVELEMAWAEERKQYDLPSLFDGDVEPTFEQARCF